jgi:hypothetical protein
MSPRRMRFEAKVFQADSVRFEACGAFRPGDDVDVCRCGWLEVDHVATAPVSEVRPLHRRQVPRPVPVAAQERRAS